MGNKDAFREWAASNVFPRFLRVTFAAYANLEANGHARFRRSELAGLLGEKVDGVWIPTARQRVREAIDNAIDRDLLMPGSKALCLIVPRMVVAFGKGNPDKPCPRHPTKRNARSVSVDLETTRFQPVVSPPDERQSRVVSRARSLVSLPPAAERQESPSPDHTTAGLRTGRGGEGASA
jgi:hypothetical protein